MLKVYANGIDDFPKFVFIPFASDVVVDKSMRGRNLGIKLIEALKYLAQNLGCYKLILDCSQVNHFWIRQSG